MYSIIYVEKGYAIYFYYNMYRVLRHFVAPQFLPNHAFPDEYTTDLTLTTVNSKDINLV